jgi:GT2 family glycosyltransferase
MSAATSVVSIVIPTRDRPEELRACLEALERQSFPRERFEVVVVDDGSSSPPVSLIESLKAQIRATLFVQANSGPAAARNAGARRASGQIVAFTDDDCRPEPHWVRALAARIDDDPDALVGGHTVNALPDNPYATASQLLVSYLYDYYNRSPEAALFLTSNNFAMRRDRFHALGGFDERFPLAGGEDRDFCDRWLREGMRLVHTPDAVVRHAHPLSLTSFIRQHTNYGRGAFHYHQLRRERSDDPVPIEPPRFYVDLVLYPTRLDGMRGRWRLAALLGLSQVANAAGFFTEKLRHRAARLRSRAIVVA